MGPVKRSKATLRVIGDNLVPEQITALLGAQPTKAFTKGEAISSKCGTFTRRSGSWHLSAQTAEPENLDKQIQEIFEQLTPDLSIWKNLSRQFRIDLFCGLFLGSTNEGVSLSSETLLAAGQRGIEIGLDIYEQDRKSRNDA